MEQNVFRRFWVALLPKARANSDLFSNVNPSGEQWITASVRGHQFNFYSRQHDGQVEVYITSGSKEENRRRFDALLAHKDAIESTFGEPLEWMPLEGGKACRIRKKIEVGGYRSPEESWPDIHDAHVEAIYRLEKAIRPRLS